jgi:hypothetical protein
MIQPWLAADPLAKRLDGLDAETIYEVAERAAILEYEAGMDRETAEAEASGGA